MSYSENKYKDFDIEDWVTDDDFIAYAHGEAFPVFEELKKDPILAGKMEEARKVILNLSNFKSEVDDQKIDEIFNRINHSIDQSINDSKPKTKISSMRWVGIAAAVITLFVVAFPFIFQGESNHITTIAQQEEFKLPDSSQVRLNSVSSIKYNQRSWNKDRYLVLKGEAFFNVKKGSKFVVKSPQGVVSVLGTQFNVSDRLDVFEVECLEGKVQVSLNIGDSYILNKGDKFIRKGKQKPVLEKNVVKEIDWLNKFVNFDNQELSYVFDEISRHFEVKFENIDSLKKEKYSGFFTTTSLDSAIYQIFWPMGIDYEIKGKKVVVK